MYELTKKKSTGLRIVYGIVICIFISGALRMAFQEPEFSLNEKMIKAANEINSHAPIIIDSATRFDNVNALQGDVFQYNYTLTTLERTEVDTILLKTTGRESMIQQMKQDPRISVFRENNIEVRLRYSDKNGADIMTISILPGEY